ncbi:MAG TPA: hypothetical protein VH601_03260 [Bryobacteraceae bacterium]|jgi:photosystem II stability/assembly factor-like uncharacterized protein
MIRRGFLPCAATVAAGALGLAAWAGNASIPDWRIAGPFGGTATAVTLDPGNTSLVLAGGMNSLLFRSQDAGANWELLNLPKLHLSEVSSILIDPADSKHYLISIVSAEGGGLFESTDRGKTWCAAPNFRNVGVRALAAAASQPSRFVAGTHQGVWLSDDSGKTWRRISDPENFEMQGISAIAVDIKDPNVIYAGTSHLPWKTVDAGQTWRSIREGMIDDSDVFSIYVDTANPATVLASACSGIYSSDNRGDTWRKLMGIPNTSRRTHVVRQDPSNESILYAGTTTGLFKSVDRGVSWKTLTDTQVNSMVLDPRSPAQMYLALEYDGIGKSYNGGHQISLANHGFVDRAISAVTQSGNKFVAIESQNDGTSGVFLSTDHGDTWSQLHGIRGLAGVHLKTIAGMRSEDRILVAASSRQLYKSIDAGMTWKPIPVRLVIPPPPQPPAKNVQETARRTARSKASAHAGTRPPAKPVVKIREINPSEVSALYSVPSGTREVMFAATDLGLLRSDDAGERWNQTAVPGSAGVSGLYFAPNYNGYMIARGAAGLFASKDYGDHWTEIRFPLPASDVNDIAIPAAENAPLLVATRVGLYLSRDGGATWFANLGGIPASTVSAVIYMGANQTAYAVEYGRLFQTTDSGASWTAIPSSILNLRIRQLWMPDTSSGRLYGLTSDLGIIVRE